MVVSTSVGSSFLCTGAVFFDSGTSVSKRGLRRIFGKISQKSEPSADFTRFGNFHFFIFFYFLVTPDLIIYVSPHETPDRSMRICSMGAGDFITYVNPNETPNTSMRICSMGAGDFITYVNPNESPNRSMRICSMGPGDFITYVNPKSTPNRSNYAYMFHGARRL